MQEWFRGQGRIPAAQVALLCLGLLLLAALGEWVGFQCARWVGELSMLGAVGAAIIIAAMIGARFGRRKILWAGLAGFCLGYAVGLLNYSYLYWVRVVLLHEIDAGLFNYFGALYGAALQITAIICGVVAAVTARLR